jgi:hypothetical protein
MIATAVQAFHVHFFRKKTMIFNRTHTTAASGLLLASALFGHAEAAHAGNLYGARLSCYVDTSAFDYPTSGICQSA